MPQRTRPVLEVLIDHVDNRFGWRAEMRLEGQEFRATYEETDRRLAELVSSPIV